MRTGLCRTLHVAFNTLGVIGGRNLLLADAFANVMTIWTGAHASQAPRNRDCLCMKRAPA